MVQRSEFNFKEFFVTFQPLFLLYMSELTADFPVVS